MTKSSVGLRTLFLFLSSIILFLNSQKNSLLFFQTCSIILAVMMSICCNRPFSCQFWLGDITQIVKNQKHWLRIQNLPIGQSFERATKACVLGYMASSCAALSNFTMMRSKILLPGATQNEYATTSFYYSSIIAIPECLPLFSKLFWHNVHRPSLLCT